MLKSIKNMPVIFDKFAIMTDDGHFLCAERGGGSRLVADREGVAIWETFRIIDLDNNKVAFRTYNDHYLSLADTRDIDAKLDSIEKRSEFELIELEDNKIALKAANGLFVCAEKGGDDKVRARSEYVKPWEVFRLLRVNSFGLISFNGNYATCKDGKITFTSKELESNEKFKFVKVDKDKVAILAPNGKYVSVDGYGSYAKADKPGTSSVFFVEEIDSEHIRLKTLNGKYITAIGGGGFMMRARKDTAGMWENIRIYPATPEINK